MRAALINQSATDARGREIADRLNDVVTRENMPDDEDGAARSWSPPANSTRPGRRVADERPRSEVYASGLGLSGWSG
jgi:hypothetical protein